jgi:hypothetical protein
MWWKLTDNCSDNEMARFCPECSAPIPEGGSCRENLHELLFIEAQIPGGPGARPHFYAVACYGLQHPDSMNYTAETLVNLHTALADALDGRAGASDLRRRASRATEGSRRITRRAGEPEVAWKRGAWPMNIADVITVEAVADAYATRVLQWARSVRETLDQYHKEKSGNVLDSRL